METRFRREITWLSRSRSIDPSARQRADSPRTAAHAKAFRARARKSLAKGAAGGISLRLAEGSSERQQGSQRAPHRRLVITYEPEPLIGTEDATDKNLLLLFGLSSKQSHAWTYAGTLADLFHFPVASVAAATARTVTSTTAYRVWLEYQTVMSVVIGRKRKRYMHQRPTMAATRP